MIEGLIEGTPIEQLPDKALGTLRNKRETLQKALDGELSPRHRFVPQHLHNHTRFLETELESLDAYLIAAMAPYAEHWHLPSNSAGHLSNCPAAMILAEIGTDLSVFGDASHFAG